MTVYDDRKRPAALNLTPVRSASTDSSSSTSSLDKPPRTPRFAEATSIHSPVEARGDQHVFPESQPGDIGFGYINNNRESATVPMSPRSPLKSAMKVPGTPGRALNPLSPTFREEQVLEKREASTDVEQARDLVRLVHVHDVRSRQGKYADHKARKLKQESGWPSLHCVVSTSAAA